MSQLVLRVNQLDALQYDDQIFSSLKEQVKSAFHITNFNVLSYIEPEANAILRYVLWKFSIAKNDATIGQDMLQTQYKVANKEGGYQSLSSKQKKLHFAVTIYCQWLYERHTDFLKILRYFFNTENIELLIKRLEVCLQASTLINFLIFLRYGQHVSLSERILSMHQVFRGQPSVRSVSYEYSNREVLWDALIDFIFFLVPLVNWKKIKSNVDRIIYKRMHNNLSQNASISEVNKKCPVCSSFPNNSHISTCCHVYCYYCLMEKAMGDSSATCNLCDAPLSEDCRPAPILDPT